jgi:hypothetical protein
MFGVKHDTYLFGMYHVLAKAHFEGNTVHVTLGNFPLSTTTTAATVDPTPDQKRVKMAPDVKPIYGYHLDRHPYRGL